MPKQMLGQFGHPVGCTQLRGWRGGLSHDTKMPPDCGWFQPDRAEGVKSFHRPDSNDGDERERPSRTNTRRLRAADEENVHVSPFRRLGWRKRR